MRNLAKRLADLIALALILPAFCLYLTAKLLLGTERAFPAWPQLLGLIPGITGVYLRRAFYSLALRRCEAGSWIGFGTLFSHASAEVGRNVYVGSYCCLGIVTLDDDVLIGSQVCVMNGSAQHGIQRLDIPIREQPGVWPRITIGCDSWIGDRAVIMADVGKHCVIGAGSVVTRPIPDYAIAVGAPARVVRFRNHDVPQSEASELLLH